MSRANKLLEKQLDNIIDQRVNKGFRINNERASRTKKRRNARRTKKGK